MIQPSSGPNHRRWARHRIDVRLKVALSLEGKRTVLFGRGNILSEGGMGVFIPCAIPLGTELLLEVSFPYSPAEVRLKAVVRSCEGFRYGLEFTRLPDEVRAIIVKNCDEASLLQ